MKKPQIHTWIWIGIGVILLIAFSLRAFLFFADHSYTYQSDYNRDYLVAKHIMVYGEHLLTGPDGQFGSQGNSPAYYYFLSLFFIFGDSLLAFGVAHLFLQMAGLIGLFIFTKILFGLRAALIALTLTSVLDVFVYYAGFPWQPHIMLPFFIFSLLCLALAHTTEKKHYLYLAIVLFILATTFHQSILVITPVFMVALFFLSKKYPKERLFISLFAPLLLLVTLYIPVVIYHLTHQDEAVVYTIFLTHERSLFDLFTQYIQRFTLFLQVMHGQLVLLGITFFTLITLVIAKRIHKEKDERAVLLSLIASGGVLFLALGFISIPSVITFPIRYFAPLNIIYVILIAVALSHLSRIKQSGILVSLLMILVLIVIGTSEQRGKFSENISTFSWEQEFDSTAIVLRSLAENTPEFDPEHILAYTFVRGVHDDYGNEIFWVSLEESLKRKLVSLDDSMLRDYKTPASPTQTITRCKEMSLQQCIDVMIEKYPNTVFMKTWSIENERFVFLLLR